MARREKGQKGINKVRKPKTPGKSSSLYFNFGKGDAIENRKRKIWKVAEPMELRRLHELFFKCRSAEWQIIIL